MALITNLVVFSIQIAFVQVFNKLITETVQVRQSMEFCETESNITVVRVEQSIDFDTH